MTMLNEIAPLSAEEEPDFLQFALEGMAKCENEWRTSGVVYSWIDPYPVWISAGDWNEYLGEGFPRGSPWKAADASSGLVLSAADRYESSSIGPTIAAINSFVPSPIRSCLFLPIPIKDCADIAAI